MPSGDDVFGPLLDDQRLALIDAFCDGMDRIGMVWDVGKKVRFFRLLFRSFDRLHGENVRGLTSLVLQFAAMVRMDRNRLAERAMGRRRQVNGNGSGSHQLSPHDDGQGGRSSY